MLQKQMILQMPHQPLQLLQQPPPPQQQLLFQAMKQDVTVLMTPCTPQDQSYIQSF